MLLSECNAKFVWGLNSIMSGKFFNLCFGLYGFRFYTIASIKREWSQSTLCNITYNVHRKWKLAQYFDSITWFNDLPLVDMFGCWKNKVNLVFKIDSGRSSLKLNKGIAVCGNSCLGPLIRSSDILFVFCEWDNLIWKQI
jgi:hypothetical protein